MSFNNNIPDFLDYNSDSETSGISEDLESSDSRSELSEVEPALHPRIRRHRILQRTRLYLNQVIINSWANPALGEYNHPIPETERRNRVRENNSYSQQVGPDNNLIDLPWIHRPRLVIQINSEAYPTFEILDETTGFFSVIAYPDYTDISIGRDARIVLRALFRSFLESRFLGIAEALQLPLLEEVNSDSSERS